MRSFLPIAWVAWVVILGLVSPAVRAQAPRPPEEGEPAGGEPEPEPPGAQAPEAPAAEPPEVEAGEEVEPEPAEEAAPGAEGEEPLESPQLRRPTVEPLTMPDVGGAAGAEEGLEGEPEEPSPDAAADLLEQAEQEAMPPSSDPTLATWTAPEAVLTLHGYFRVRWEMWDRFFLGRDDPLSTGTDLPFSLFRPIDRNATPEGGCGDEPALGMETEEDRCGASDRLRFANMRLRLQPTLSVSDDVRVHMMVDVFDNLVLGSTPEGTFFDPNDGFRRQTRRPTAGVPIDSFAASQDPPSALRNGLRDSIRVRRAWAEVTNRGLGQLRFGRMGSHWGLGLLANGGEGIDSDFQTDVDRIMAITKLAGFYFVGAWDWAGEGYILQDRGDLDGIPFDATNKDDIRQLVFAVARRETEEEQQAKLQRGDWVLNGGAYFVWRKQDFSSSGLTDPFLTAPRGRLVRRKAKAYIPDLWVQFLWRDLRIEAEAVMVIGEIQNLQQDSFRLDNLNLLQFGGALEAEYRLLEDKLGIQFHTGYATGDPDVDGLSDREGFLAQATDDNDATTFRFHPNYRIDLILFRNILGRVAGAYYFRPGVSYDIIRNAFGQLLGVRADVVYSRAAQEVQTYGSDPNLGVEIDVSAYYRSEDGPDPLDGFYAQFQYGLLFPLGGLGFTSRVRTDTVNTDLDNAQIVRLLLGVQY